MMRLALAAAFLLAAGITALSFSPVLRSSSMLNSRACYHELYFERRFDARVAIIGSSRPRRAFETAQIEAQLGLPKDAIVNLSHPGSYSMLDYDILKLMLSEKRLGSDLDVLVVNAMTMSRKQLEVEVDAKNRSFLFTTAISGGPVERPLLMWSSLATLGKIAKMETQEPFLASWNFLRLLSERVKNNARLVLAGPQKWDVFGPDTDTDTTLRNQCFNREWHALGVGTGGIPKVKEEYRIAFEGKPAAGDFDPTDFLTNPVFNIQRTGLQWIAALAEEKGIKAFALYIPGIHTPQLPQTFLDRFEQEIGMPLVTFDPDLRAKLGDAGYYDPVHLSVAGRTLASEWLADLIAQDVPVQ